MATQDPGWWGKTKWKQPDYHTPSNCTGKKTRANQTDCLVYEKVILEPDDKNDGHDEVFCEGDCQGWIHRQCAGLTHPAFD